MARRGGGGGVAYDQDSCVVCLCEFEDGDLVTVLPCFHEFHTECIEPWLLKKLADHPNKWLEIDTVHPDAEQISALKRAFDTTNQELLPYYIGRLTTGAEVYVCYTRPILS